MIQNSESIDRLVLVYLPTSSAHSAGKNGEIYKSFNVGILYDEL